MTDDPEQTRSPPAKPPPSFGGVAKRIRSRTTDLLAIAIIVIGGITVGTRVSGWFAEDESQGPGPSAVNAVGGPGVALGDEPLTLDFGGLPYRMHRSVVKGDRKAAIRQLLKKCRELGTASRRPTSPPSTAERKLLAKLVGHEAVQALPDGGRLYRFDGPVTMVSFTRPDQPTESRDKCASESRRVVCWGLAFPVLAGEKQWTLSLFTPAGQTPTADDLPEIPLPTNARAILTIRGNQSAWRTFRSGEDLATVRRFYESMFESERWSLRESNSAPAWTAVFVKNSKAGRFRAEVHVSQEHNDATSGVLFVTRPGEERE
ncbi:MAG: hypothetical protein ACE5KM_02375 [Planctomycetaceae bacterium]